MYTRDIKPPAASPVHEGKPLQGTWTRPFERVDLLEIARPFSLPIPNWLANLRIKEWQSVIVQNDEAYFMAFAANLKLLRFLGAVFCDKKSGGIKRYIDYAPLTFWELPRSLADSYAECGGLGCSMSIHPQLDASRLNFAFSVYSPDGLSEMETGFEINFDPVKSPPLVTNLLFSEERPVYTYKSVGRVQGQLTLGEEGRRYHFNPETTLSLFRDSKGFFPYITRCQWAHGLGIEKNGRLISFSLAELGTRSANTDNENVLWVNGALSALPPVRITHEGGLGGDWVIEDVEGMIDLSFTPRRPPDRDGYDLIISKAEYYNPDGVFNGMIMNKDGEKIQLRNFAGCAENLYLRL
jgi:hypothetical protein